jgi:hypothetical protein
MLLRGRDGEEEEEEEGVELMIPTALTTPPLSSPGVEEGKESKDEAPLVTLTNLPLQVIAAAAA